MTCARDCLRVWLSARAEAGLLWLAKGNLWGRGLVFKILNF